VTKREEYKKRLPFVNHSMMNETPKEKLKRLSDEYKAAQKKLEDKNRIEVKREELEVGIEKLEKDVEASTFEFYRQPRTSIGQTLPIPTQKSLKLLKEAKKGRKQLDAELDALELISDDMCRKLRNQLIQTIIVVYPKAKPQHESLSAQIKEHQENIELMQQIAGSLNEILALLAEIARQRTAIKKKGILRYLFGPNPNYIISKNLNQIAHLATKTLERLEALGLDRAKRHPWFNPLFLRLDTLKKQALERWGWKTLDNAIIPELNLLNGLKNELKSVQEEYEANIETLHSGIEFWIEKHSQLNGF